jgi:hypothetical protein
MLPPHFESTFVSVYRLAALPEENDREADRRNDFRRE